MKIIQETRREEQPSTQAQTPAFIGRSDLLDTIKQHLLKGQHVCLYGDRGIGKTAITEEVVRWLREEKPGLRVIHLADEMTFKNLLIQLARELHELGLFQHPIIPPDEMATLAWPQISKRTRALTLHELGSAVVTSLRGEGVLLVMDSVNKVKPTDQAWLQDIIKNAVCLLATRDKDEKNLKPLLARFELVYVPPLSRSEAYDLMEAFLTEHPVPSTDPKHYRKAVWDASKGYPNAIRDLIWKGSLEKYVDKEHIRGLAHDAGVRGFSIAPGMLILVADLTVSLNAAIKKGDVIVRDRIAARELDVVKVETVGVKEQWQEQQRITAAELRDLRDKVAKEESVLRRLQERHAVYSGAADLLAKERKQLSTEIEAQETKASGLRSDLSQRAMKQRVDALQQENKLRDLAGRQAKLEAEAVMFSTVTGTVIGMETEHGAESITVKLAVATTKGGADGQRQQGNEDRKNQ